tara:strand:+ start:669 stop:1115 length:447 start_codon:yes stop_codon:yes gene_type:complete
MTTIAYCRKENKIAHDSRTTSGSLVISDCSEKIVRHGDSISFMCGSVPDYDDFNSNFENGKKSERVFDVESITITGGKVFLRSFDPTDMTFWQVEILSNRAIGSGMMSAFTAMSMGCTAEDAVKVACELDVYSGGEVKVFDVKAMEYV